MNSNKAFWIWIWQLTIGDPGWHPIELYCIQTVDVDGCLWWVHTLGYTGSSLYWCVLAEATASTIHSWHGVLIATEGSQALIYGKTRKCEHQRIFGHKLTSIDTWWPSDAIWWHKSASTLIQVMACCLTAPSHYLNQYFWLLIRKVLSTWEQFHKKPQPVTCVGRYISKLQAHLPGANELNDILYS